MESHKVNMYAGAVIGSLLFFLLLNFFSQQIYGTREHRAHEPLAFALEIEGATGAEAAAEAVDYAALVASADAAAGEKLFGKCKSCHSVEEGKNGVGPSLWGVVGHDIGSAAGYSYSDTLANMEGEWTLENLAHFLESPKEFAPGTKMGFAGLKDPEDQVNLIVYLNEADGSPIELAAAPTAAVETTGTQTDAQTDAAAATTEAPAAPAAESTEAASTETTETAAATTETAPQQPAAESTEAASTETTETAAATTETAPQQPAAEGAEAAQPAAAAAGGGAYAELLAAADAAEGEKVFRKCKACHTVEEGKNRVGPSLWGVVGRAVGGAEGYSYSDAMKGHGGEWTLETLDAFLADPKGAIPGNKMSFPGVKDAQDRVDVITYLNEADGSPEPLGQ